MFYVIKVTWWDADYTLAFRMIMTQLFRSFCGWFTFLPPSPDFLPSYYDFPEASKCDLIDQMKFMCILYPVRALRGTRSYPGELSTLFNKATNYFFLPPPPRQTTINLLSLLQSIVLLVQQTVRRIQLQIYYHLLRSLVAMLLWLLLLLIICMLGSTTYLQFSYI